MEGHVNNTYLVRILGAHSDLHAADARYHRKCNAVFHCGTHRVSYTDRKSDADDQAFYETINIVSSDHSRLWNYIHVEAVNSDKCGCMMARRALVDKIVQHFGDEILSLHSPGVNTTSV